MPGTQPFPKSVIVRATGIPSDELASLTAESIFAGDGERGKLGAQVGDMFVNGLHGCWSWFRRRLVSHIPEEKKAESETEIVIASAHR